MRGDVGFGLVVRLRAGGEQFAAAGAARSRRFGVSLFGERGGAGSLDTERVPAATQQGVERFVHASGGAGAGQWLLGGLGHVAIDSTRVAANASRNRVDTEQALREARARIRRDIRHWQKQCDADDPNEGAGNEVDGSVMDRLEQQLQGIPERLERLQKSGLKKVSQSDPDRRFLRERGGFTLGYTATLAVREDHLIVTQQIGQASTDNELLVPMVDLVEQQCGERPRQASADSGFFLSLTCKQRKSATSTRTCRTTTWRGC